MKVRNLIIALLLFSQVISAGENKRGEAGFAFLKIPLGAREVSLGSTGLTTTSGAGAMFWNPANVALDDRPSVSFSYLSHFAGITSNYGAVSFPAGDVGVFGVSVNYLSYGDIGVTTTEQPNGTGAKYSPYDVAVGFTYSKQLTDRVSGGATVKFVNSTISTVSASNVLLDFGFMYNTGFKNLKMGFVIANIGPQTSYNGTGLGQEVVTNPNATDPTSFLRYGSEPFEMPASVSFGFSMDVFQNEQNSITGTVEQNVNSFQASRTNFGLEYGFQQMFFVRGGYTSTFKKDMDYASGESMGGLSLGAGIDYKVSDKFRTAFDYGYLNTGALGSTHRFSVGLKF